MKGISIIICCYNSALRLPETLRHIALQEVSSDIPWEVIIVNNASTDDTASIAKIVWLKYSSNAGFIVVEQHTPGLSAARKKGIETSKYEYVIFCDDDNWLAINWAQRVYEIFESNPEIGIMGGNNTAVFETTPPFWFEELKGSFAVGEQNKGSADVTDIRGYIWGAGLSFRKSVYTFINNQGFNSFLSDRKGNKMSAGGDTELCYLFRMAGFRIWYFEDLKLQHFIPVSRMNPNVLPKMHKGFGESRYYFDLYNYVITDSQKSFSRIYFRYFVNLIKNIFSAFPVFVKAERNSNLKCLYFWYSYQIFLTATKNILSFSSQIKKIRILNERILKGQS